MATAKGKPDSADCARKTVLTGQTVLWIKDVQCCADSMTDGQRQCNKQRQGRQMAPQPQTLQKKYMQKHPKTDPNKTGQQGVQPL
jgi:hypothetical protein